MSKASRVLVRVLIGVLAGVLLLCGGAVALGAWVWSQLDISTVGKVDFTRPLAVPPLAESRIDEQGRRVFDLRAQAGRRDFGVGSATRTWGFNGDYLGPTLRAKRGEQVVVNVANSLDEPTTVHWHGMHLPAAMDGGPHQMVHPGATWSPTWTINQPAATLWYHPHPHGQTEKHVYRGLAGMFIVDDDQAATLDLPQRYGVDDFPVIVQDRKFDGNGQFDETANYLSDVGLLGDTLLVNGTLGPYLDVTTERVRLRLLNGSTGRTYEFGLADNRTFSLIGTDGGLLSAPHHTQRIRLSPGERAEIVVAVQPGERVVLRSFPANLAEGYLNRFAGGADSFDVLQLRAADTLAPAPEVPGTLVPIERIDAASSTVTRKFQLIGTTINGRKMDMGRIDEVVTIGATEIWEITNRDGSPHNFHVHDVQFQVLSVAGRQPSAELGGWKDTIFLPPKQSVRIIMRFADYTDPNMPYMYHCHQLLHEDQGMMGQFVVVEPGQQPGRPPQDGSGHDHHS